MLTLKNKKGQIALACIEGGKLSSKLISLDLTGNKDDSHIENLDYFLQVAIRDVLKGRTVLTERQLITLEESMENDETPKDPLLNRVYTYAKEIQGSNEGKVIDIEDPNSWVRLIPYNRKDQNDVMRCAISGSSGSGKSTLAGSLAECFLDTRARGKVYLFSLKDSDGAFDRLAKIFGRRYQRVDLTMISDYIEREKKIKRANIGRKKASEQDIEPEPLQKITIDSFEEGSLIIFDDIGISSDKELRKEIASIRDQVLERGRSKQLSVISIQHILTDHNETKYVLNESNMFIWFPGSVNQGQLDRVLGIYKGLDYNQIKRVKKVKQSRWICIYSTVPKVIVYETGAFIL